MGRRRRCSSLHLSFSSSVPREVTDRAWMNSENSMRPSCRVTKGREREREGGGNGPETRWASYFTLAVLSWAPCSPFHDVLARCVLLKMGPDVCSKSAAIFALHLALSWGSGMSPPVISKMDAAGPRSKKPTAHKQRPQVRGIFESRHVQQGRKHSSPQSPQFPITLPETQPSALFCEATLCAADRKRLLTRIMIKCRIAAQMSLIRGDSSSYDLQPWAAAAGHLLKSHWGAA